MMKRNGSATALRRLGFGGNVTRLAVAVALAGALTAVLLFLSAPQALGDADTEGAPAFTNHIHTIVIQEGDAYDRYLPNALGIGHLNNQVYSQTGWTLPSGVTLTLTGTEKRRLQIPSTTSDFETVRFTWTGTHGTDSTKTASMPVSITIIPKACGGGDDWRPSAWSSMTYTQRAALTKECNILLSMKKVWSDAESGTLPAGFPNWDKGTPITSWTGVTLSGNQHRVTRLTLGSDSLTLKGGIPGQIGGLTELSHLTIARNPDLAGVLPPEVGEMISLEFLNLSGNGHTGAIPAGITDATKLKRIYLGNNALTGGLPHNYDNLTNLEVLDLWNNNLGNTSATAVFPFDDVGDSTDGLLKLKKLHLGGNNFDNVASEFAGLENLTELTALDLSHNNMSGDIMDELDDLTKLTILKINDNDETSGTNTGFSGDIAKLKALTALKFLKLSNNDFAGTNGIPADLKALTNLRVFELYQDDSSGSQITGSISSDLSALTRLQILDLHGQNLSGSLPNIFSSLTSLEDLNLADNNFTGTIPSGFGSISPNTINLSGNSFSGSIPSDIGSNQSLLRLDLSDNNLSGDSLPANFRRLDLLPWGLNLTGNWNLLRMRANMTTTIPKRAGDTKARQLTEGDSESVPVKVTFSDDFMWVSQFKPIKDLDTCPDDWYGHVPSSCLASHPAMTIEATAQTDAYWNTSVSPSSQTITIPTDGSNSVTVNFTVSSTEKAGKQYSKRDVEFTSKIGETWLPGVLGKTNPDDGNFWGQTRIDILEKTPNADYNLSNLVIVNSDSDSDDDDQPDPPVINGLRLPGTATPTPTPDFDGQTHAVYHATIASNGCLDVFGGVATNGRSVQSWDCNNTPAQQWTFEKRTSGAYSGDYRLVSKVGDGSTYCLDNRGDFETSDEMGIWTCVSDSHGSVANQTVSIRAIGSGYSLTFVDGDDSSWLSTDRASTNPRGGVGQTEVFGFTPNGAIWRIGASPVSSNSDDDDDDSDEDSDDNDSETPVVTPTATPVATPAPTPAPSNDPFDGSIFEVQHVTSASTSCLDVSYGEASDGQDVWMWACNDTNAQKWMFERRTAGDYAGTYRLVSQVGDKSYCLDNRGDFSTSDRMGIWSCVSDTHGAAANQSVTINGQAGGYTITFSNGSSSSWLVTDRSDDNVYGEANQVSTGGSAGSTGIWRIESG